MSFDRPLFGELSPPLDFDLFDGVLEGPFLNLRRSIWTSFETILFKIVEETSESGCPSASLIYCFTYLSKNVYKDSAYKYYPF